MIDIIYPISSMQNTIKVTNEQRFSSADFTPQQMIGSIPGITSKCLMHHVSRLLWC